MEKYFALIKNNLVTKIIVADDEFVQLIEKEYDHIIDVTSINRPHAGDSYYPDTQNFISNTHIPVINIDINQDHMKQGTEIGFEPFQLSKYSVSYKDGMVTIGCKDYPITIMKDALHKFVIEGQKNHHYFGTLDGKPGHGKFDITWNDVLALHNALSKVKL